jgi:hypothetical protein
MSDPMPGSAVTVRVSADVLKDLAKMQKVTANVLARLGCPGCHSGHLLNFQDIREFVVNSKTLDVHEFGVGQG